MGKYIINKEQLFNDFKLHETDTGSAFVQTVLLTFKINYITEHLKEHKTDYDARRSLLIKVAKRRKYLFYIKKSFPDRYDHFIKALNIRDTSK